jgi:uncharacterized membrane protein YoaK (UPF0700 family)
VKPENPFAETQRSKSIVALVLTFVAGLIDIVGYLAIYHIFTAHLSGTTVQLGRNLIAHNWAAAGIAGSVVAGFFAGSIIGRAAIEAAARRHLRRVASMNLAGQAALLILFIQLAKHPSSPREAQRACILLLLLAAAMGLQTATLTRLGALTIHTTFITGMINKLAQVVSHMLFHTYDLLRATKADQKDYYRRLRQDNERQAWFFFSIWLMYLAGAASGTELYLKRGLAAMYVPAVLIVLTIVTDRVKPLSLQEERDQSER